MPASKKRRGRGHYIPPYKNGPAQRVHAPVFKMMKISDYLAKMYWTFVVFMGEQDESGKMYRTFGEIYFSEEEADAHRTSTINHEVNVHHRKIIYSKTFSLKPPIIRPGISMPVISSDYEGKIQPFKHPADTE